MHGLMKQFGGMNKMKKLIVLFIVLFSLVFVSNAFITAEATSGNVNVKITALFDAGNEVDFPEIVKAYGATVTHAEAVGAIDGTGYEFVFWVVNGVVDHTLDESATFTVTSRLNLQAVYKPVGEYVVVFVDANGVYLGSKYTAGGTVNDTGITLLGKPNYTPNGWLSIEGSSNLSNITADSVFMLQYVADGTLPTVNISVTNGTTVGEVNFNTVVTVNPDPADSGLEFSHWTENGKVVSYEDDYKFTALTDRSLTAVYVATGTVTEEVVVTLSNDLELRDGYHTYTGQVYLPTDYELVEYGFLFSSNAVILEYGNAQVIAQANNINANTNEFITSFKIGSHMAMRAYVIYFNGVSNEVEVSEVNHRYIEEVVYETGFEAPSFTSTTGYQGSITDGPDGNKWNFYFGTPSTTGAISGSQSAQMRWYTTTPSIFGYVESNFAISNVTQVKFLAANTNGINVTVSISLDNGLTWDYSETFVLSTTVKEYIYNIPHSFHEDEVRVRFQTTYSLAPTLTSRLYIDDVKFIQIYQGEVHDVTFNNEGNITNQLVAEGNTISSFTPIKTGYTFNGWYTTDSFVEPAYNFSTPVTSDLTLYAKYTINQYTITFDSNEGSPVTAITQNYGTEVSEPSYPTRTGYTFDGWFTDDNTFLSEYAFSTMTENITIYAKWNLINYNITYEGLSGESNSNPASYNIETSTINLADPGTREGYNFVGWFTAASGGSEVESIPLGSTGHITLYARWEEIPEGQVLVSYEAYDGLPAPEATLVDVDVVFAAPTQPSKTGYTFGGWFTSDEFTTQWNFAVNTTNVAMTLYAKWNLVNYTITYLGLEGASNSNPTSYNIETATITLVDPGTREGYNFLGWFTAASGGSEVESILLGSSGDKTIYSQWELVTSTTMLYQTNLNISGNSYNSGAERLATVNLVEYGSVYTLQSGSNIQGQASTMRIYNLSSLGKINSISITLTGASAHTVYAGTTSKPATTSITANIEGFKYIYYFSSGDYSYFNIHNNASAIYIVSIEINYIPES